MENIYKIAITFIITIYVAYSVTPSLPLMSIIASKAQYSKHISPADGMARFRYSLVP